MNVHHIGSRRVEIINPNFEDFASYTHFPRWFIQQVESRLMAREPYSIVAGVGLLCRFAFYFNMKPSMARKTIVAANKWAENIARSLRVNVADSFQYEIDVLESLFDRIKTLKDRNLDTWAEQVSVLKKQRDDLESVFYVLSLLDCPEIHQPIIRLDAIAHTYTDYLDGDNCMLLDPGLELLNQYIPELWWSR